MPKPHWYREPELPPQDKRFRMRVGVGQFLVVTTSVVGVEVNYYSKSRLENPDWTLWLDYTDNPQLQGLRHPQLGWDLVGLAKLLWAYVVNPNQVRLNGGQSVETGETVSAQYQVISGSQIRRESAETEALLYSVLQGANRPMTRLQLARALGLTKSPNLITIIEGMVERGDIQRIEKQLKNGKSTFLYADNGLTAQ